MKLTSDCPAFYIFAETKSTDSTTKGGFLLSSFYLKHYLALISILSFIAIELPAQEFVWGKAYSTTNPGVVFNTSVAVGDNEHVFFCGRFDNQIRFDGITLNANSTDGCIVKLDSSGNTQWAKTLGASNNGSFSQIAIDRFGDVYAVGDFSNTWQINNSIIVSDSLFNGVLVKYNGQGEVLWYKYFPNYRPQQVKVDNDGNVYMMAHRYNKRIEFGIVIAKFDRHGEQFFSNDIVKASNINFFSGTRLSVDVDNNIYISGLAGRQALIGNISYSGNSNGAFLLVKCSPNGVPEWLRVVEDAPLGGSWYQATIANDGFGNTYYHTHRDFLSLSKFDPDGNKLWSKRNKNIRFGITGMSIDEEGNLLATGEFSGIFTLGQGRFNSNSQTVYTAKFNSDGECVWALCGSDQTNDFAVSLARSQQTGALIIGGILNSPSSRFGEISLPGQIFQARMFVLKVKNDSKPQLLNLGPDRTICEGDNISISVDGFVRYEWANGSSEPTININQPGLYVLRAIDKGGYMHVDSLQIDWCLESLIPNVITPNGDGYNDYFVIEALDPTKKNTLLIYNRWGERVFADFSYRNNWNGSDLARGTYFYVLINGGTGQSYKGWVQLIK